MTIQPRTRAGTRDGAALVALVLVLATSPALAADAPPPFAPHRAIYEISLVDSTTASDVAGVTGRMVYELDGSPCKGYTQTMRYVTITTNQEGTETLSDLRNSSWEEADGAKLKFSLRQYQNDELADSSQGDAARSLGARPTAGVDLVKPTKKRVTLPGDVYFPMQHANTLVQAAKSGVKLFTANVYDGSEKGEKYFLTSTVIGKKYALGTPPSAMSVKGAEQLANVDSWPLTISYFEANKEKQDQTPYYELSFRYFENGVTSNLKIDYGEFAIKGELKELTFLDPGKCPAPTATH